MRHNFDYTLRLIVGVVCCQLSLPAFAAPVTAVIRNIPDDTGTILVALCTENEFLDPHCRYNTQIKSRAPEVSVRFADIPAGIYAVQAFQDRNGDGKLNRTFIGIPREPIGFSRNPRLRYGPPSFDECAVEITPGGGTITLDLITH